MSATCKCPAVAASAAPRAGDVAESRALSDYLALHVALDASERFTESAAPGASTDNYKW
jgi:hypothetical protein